MKLKFFRSFIINSLVAAVVGTLFILSGCKDDEPAPFVPTETILEIINGDPDLSELAGYLADPNLDDLESLLSGTTPYTFFAPNNAAFTSLYATPGFPANPADISISIIKGVIAYHIVASQILSGDMAPTGTGAGFATLYNSTNACTGATTNQVIKVNDDKTLLTGSTTTNIAIVDADRLATNGVVHVTGSVLIPPSVGATLTPILGKLAATVLLAANFTNLAQAMTKADCGVAGVTPLSNILADPSGATYTAFLPTNDVFAGTAAAQSITVQQLIDAYTAAQWRNIILNHLVSGTKSLADLAPAAEVTTLLNPGTTKLTVSSGTAGAPPASPLGKYLATSGGTTGINGGVGTTQAPIWTGDISASNGVAHVVGKILFPN